MNPMPKTLRERMAWSAYQAWLQDAASIRAEFRDLGIALPPSLGGAIHIGPAPWKTGEADSSSTDQEKK